jgi:glycerol uptake facilitator protein
MQAQALGRHGGMAEAPGRRLPVTVEASLRRQVTAEFLGTYLLVLFGVGVVHTAVLTGAQAGVGQVAVVWGLAGTLAIYATASTSGAHLNPAVTVAFAALRGFPLGKVLPYVAAQVCGAFAAGATLYGFFHRLLLRFEAQKGLTRGLPGSELSAMVYGEYFPNPGLLGTDASALASVSIEQAMLAEGLGTAVLVLCVFALTEPRNQGRPDRTFAPPCIGLALAMVISVVAPLTQAGLNPARDFGPRLWAWLAGWGEVAIPGPRGGFFTVYILAPVAGALAGAAVYEYLLKPQAEPSRDGASDARSAKAEAADPARAGMGG